MKKHLLIFAIAVAIVSFGASATMAQVPNVQIFFDNAWQYTEANCPTAPIGTVFDTLHVVALNFDAHEGDPGSRSRFTDRSGTTPQIDHRDVRLGGAIKLHDVSNTETLLECRPHVGTQAITQCETQIVLSL